MTGACVVLAGAPFTPVSHHIEEVIMHLLPTHPYLAGALILAHWFSSVVLIRFLLLRVLSARRFKRRKH
eukprot:CAMPEP_0177733290 /NCGR_PEP_ID=MMETSP0484_2-20121128/23603_1 /TAXON_ID=354590 /ORGANISM="Rhodomonas lens, Strain RHODO" /LENGTH=68 /DNA_ID=CAMNT_0019246655 /DNA_START=138 /DNA_END=344 /DNA_ORIENTATION=-